MSFFSPMRRPSRRRTKLRPRLEILDDRITPTVSSIMAQFNSAPVSAGSTLWLNSAFRVSGLPSHAVTMHVNHASVSSSAFQVAVPDAVITLSPAATAATTAFDAGTNSWLTTIPTSSGGLIGGLISGLLGGGNSFLDGAALTLSSGLAGGLRDVTFTADVTSDSPGLTVTWQWGCAVYRNFSADYNALGVKPVDGSSGNAYHNFDRGGSPESYKSFVIAGGTGNGGFNYTGSYSNSSNVAPSPWTPPPSAGTASLSGTVFQDVNFNGVQDADEFGIEGVELNLTGVDSNGNSVNFVTHTDANGHYSFTGLRAGTYRLFEVQPEHFLDGGDSVGSVNGESRGTKDGQDQIGEIVLHDGDQAVDYNFAEIFDSND
jgi:SdrD B-like domain